MIILNGTTVVDASDFATIYYNWKLVNETSKSSLPFNNGELTYNTGVSGSGIGECMNDTENVVSSDGKNLSIAPVTAANDVNTNAQCPSRDLAKGVHGRDIRRQKPTDTKSIYSI